MRHGGVGVRCNFTVADHTVIQWKGTLAASQIVSFMSVACVLALKGEGAASAEDLASARKVSRFISHTFGMSVKDLPAASRTRLEELTAT